MTLLHLSTEDMPVDNWSEQKQIAFNYLLEIWYL